MDSGNSGRRDGGGFYYEGLERSWYAYRVQKLVRISLRKVDPVAVLGGETPKDRYERVVVPIATTLVRRGKKPTAKEAAWIVYGALADSYADVKVYSTEALLPVAERIVLGWDACWMITP